MNSKENFPGKKGTWHGYDAYRFELNGIESIIVTADSPLKGNPWIWRVRFFNADPALDLAMLRHGVHLVHTDISNLAGGPEAMRRMNHFYEYLSNELNFSPTPVLESYSRGALPALNWAIRNPEKTAMLILDTPLCNLNSWPKSHFDRKLGRKAGVLSDDFSVLKEWNPVENLMPLAEQKIPVSVMFRENDDVIPVQDNAALLLQRLKDGDGNVRRYLKKDELSGDDVESLVRMALGAMYK